MTLAPIDPTSAVAVTTYLENAKTWLATAVENTGPETISKAKAELATAAEAAKQLGLSREIRDDATEMVRRAEWTVRKSTQKAQVEGCVRTHGGPRTQDADNPILDTRPAPKDFFASEEEYRDANAMADLDEDDFEEVLAEARAEGNLSRTNVANKAREKSGKASQKPVLVDSSAEYDNAEKASKSLSNAIAKLLEFQHPNMREAMRRHWSMASTEVPPTPRRDVTPEQMRVAAQGLLTLADEWSQK